MRILTNFMSAPARMEIEPGRLVQITRAEAWSEFKRLLHSSDIAVIDCRDSLLYRTCAYLRALPWRGKPVVAVDLVLRKPESARHRLSAVPKRALLSRVDHFIHYFKDVSGYSRYFGISQERSSYVPFKVNSLDVPVDPAEFREEYVIAVGRSLRDYDTYIRAVGELPYPAAMSEFGFDDFEGRPASFKWNRSNLPGNIAILPDRGGRDGLIRNIAKARLVVIPTLASSLCASGISSYLDAMYLGKCVIVSKGPGASDLLTNEAIMVPPHDVAALRDAIRLAWENEGLRREVAQRGKAYASSLGGEQDLLRRIFRQAVRATVGEVGRG